MVPGLHAVVPAYNEAPTVAGVVRTLRDAGVFATITVVDDGSRDQTSHVARAAGARVLRKPNGGKGAAMRDGVRSLPWDWRAVAFFDSDLTTLRRDHVRSMVQGSLDGFDMVCGMQDYGPGLTAATLTLPLITGQRVLRRHVVEGVHPTCWCGYAIEMALNYTVQRQGGRTLLLVLDGLDYRKKHEKDGWLAGLAGYATMTAEIARATQPLWTEGRCVCTR